MCRGIFLLFIGLVGLASLSSGWTALAQGERAWQLSRAARNPVPNPLRQAGIRYRIVIREDGIYRLSYHDLAMAGLDVANLDPTYLQMSTQGLEVAIEVENLDGNPHQLSVNESLYFYGQRFYGDRLAAIYAAEDDLWQDYITQDSSGAYVTWSPTLTAKHLEQYTRENVYWLMLGSQPGVRIAQSPAGGEAAVPTSYKSIVHAEEQSWRRPTPFTSEDTWIWADIYGGRSVTSSIQTPFPLTTGEAILRGEVIGAEQTSVTPDHHIKVYINDPTYSLSPVVDATWEGKSRFRFEQPFPASRLANGANQVELVVLKDNGGDRVYLDWLEIEYDRLYQVDSDRLAFIGAVPGLWNYRLKGFTDPSIKAYEITDPSNPRLLPISVSTDLGAYTAEVRIEHPTQASFFAASQLAIKTPDGIQAYSPPDFSLTQANYVIITHPAFTTALQRLADFHRSRGLGVQVIDVNDLYNEFNYGIYHPIAIKNFLAWAEETWSTPPQYALLVGDGHWNFLSSPSYDISPVYMPPNLAWVDPWQGEADSANLLADLDGDGLPDANIARLPVNSVGEVDAVIDKILAYAGSPRQVWQKRITFIADDPDNAGDFEGSAESLIASYLNNKFDWVVQRRYLSRQQQDGLACGATVCSSMNEAIGYTLDQGTSLVTYLGHADIQNWAGESIYNVGNVSSLQNTTALPVILSMDCLDGYWYHPGSPGTPYPSLIEELLRTPGRGAVAAFSPTGLGVATGHDLLLEGFFEELIERRNLNLGEAALAAKVKLYNVSPRDDLLQTFTIFGDPALEMQVYPYYQVMIPLTFQRIGVK